MILILLPVILLVAVIFPHFFPRVTEELIVEAGSPLPTISDFLSPVPDDAVITEGLDRSVDMNVPGEHRVCLNFRERSVTSILRIVDTTPPSVTAKNVESYPCTELAAAEFISAVEDVSPVTLSYAAEPDLISVGERDVRILATDAGGNTTEVSATLTILADSEPPVITGVRRLTVEIGGTVSYKNGVTVTDNSGAQAKLTVDNDGVDLNRLGEYTITYKAEDLSGNVAQEETVLLVIAPLEEGVSEEVVNAAADTILSQITTPEMTQFEVLRAIYNWCYGNIRYVDQSPKDSWIQGAYSGLVKHRGDCYVFAMSTKCLLDRAGIKNMDIHKTTATTLHCWNLVDIGEGWHHLDTVPRIDGTRFFYLTDAELMAYSTTHNGTHAYDPSQYPEIP